MEVTRVTTDRGSTPSGLALSLAKRAVALVETPLRNRRQQQREAIPRVALEPRHVENCKVLTDRVALLELLPHNAVVAEIGVAFGDFSQQILEIAQPAKLHLIDAWEGERYGSGLETIETKFAAQIKREQVVVSRGYSTDRLAEFPDDYFDWVYIDTSHSYSTTRDELALAEKKVKRGGLIAGHDFCKGNVVAPVVYGVVQACGEFCLNRGWGYKYLTLETHGDFSFCIERLKEAN